MTFFRKPTTLRKIGVVVLAAAVVSGACVRVLGFDEDATVVTVDGTELSLGYANFVAKYIQAQNDMTWVYYLGEGYWTDESLADEDGNTWEDTTKEEVLEQIELMVLLVEHMDDYGVEFTADDLTAVTLAAEQFIDDNSQETLDEMSATTGVVSDYLYYETVAIRMEEAIKAEADTDVTDEEAAQRTFSYLTITVSGTYTDDDGESQEYTDEEVEENIAAAEEFLELAQEDFDAAAEEYGYTVYTYSYGDDEESSDDGGFNEDVIAAVDELSEGELTGLIESEDRYYIARLDSEFDEEATETRKEEIIEERQEELYEEVTQGYLDEATIKVNKRQWAKIELDNAFLDLSTEDDEDTSVSE